MARFKRLETLVKMDELGLVPVFYHGDAQTAQNVARACHDAGACLIEFTNRGDFACDIFAQLETFARKELPHAILGVGSIIDPYIASLYIARGANFVVGPVLNSQVAKLCHRHGIPYIPGCGSATEIEQAYELGCPMVKVFPGDSVGGPNFVKSVRGPMPWVSIMPTGGVSPTLESLTAWFKAGVVAVGIGSNLITQELIGRNDFAAMADNIRQTLALIKTIRGR